MRSRGGCLALNIPPRIALVGWLLKIWLLDKKILVGEAFRRRIVRFIRAYVYGIQSSPHFDDCSFSIGWLRNQIAAKNAPNSTVETWR